MDECKNPQSKRILVHLLVILILDLLAFTTILPLFPAIVDFYETKSTPGDLYNVVEQQLQSFRSAIGAPNVARFNAVFFGGLLGSLFSFLQFLSSPTLGALSDIYGRKSVLLLSVIGTLASYAIWAQSSTFELFVLSRIVGGISKASVSIVTAMTADVMDVKRRGQGMALVGVSFSVGFIVGPMIGAYFASKARQNIVTSDTFYATPAWFAIILTIAELIWIAAFLPETLPQEKRKRRLSDIARQVIDYVNPNALFRFKPMENNVSKKSLAFIKSIGLVYFVYLLIYSGLEFTLTFFTHLRFEYDSIQQGRMYFFSGILMTFVQGAYVRRIPIEKQQAAAQWGITFIVPSFILIGLAQSKLMFYSGLALYAVASAIVVTCLTTVVSSYGSDADKGTIVGVFRALGALSRALGPVIASAVFWLLGPTACYVMGGLLLSIPYFLLRQSGLPKFEQ